MGRWSDCIMGGDGPMDAQGEILDFIGFDHQDYERHHADHLDEVKALLDKVDEEGWQTLFAQHEETSFGDDIKFVACVLIIESGASLPHGVAKAALDLCETEKQEGYRGADRQWYIEEFVSAINRYDGTPIELSHESLLDKLADAIYADKPKARLH